VQCRKLVAKVGVAVVTKPDKGNGAAGDGLEIEIGRRQGRQHNRGAVYQIHNFFIRVGIHQGQSNGRRLQLSRTWGGTAVATTAVGKTPTSRARRTFIMMVLDKEIGDGCLYREKSDSTWKVLLDIVEPVHTPLKIEHTPFFPYTKLSTPRFARTKN
jgi:hypothetical protein